MNGQLSYNRLNLHGDKPRLGIDVDNVIVRTDIHWNCWLMNMCHAMSSKLPEKDIEYNISEYYPEVVNPMDWWRKENLYDRLHPTSDSVRSIDKLSKYFDIIFISTIKGNHHKSKFNFLKKHFPYMKGFLATKEKGLVDVDIMIEDRATNLDLFPDRVYKVLYKTMYKQDNPNHGYRAAEGWNEVYNRCMTYLDALNCLNEKTHRKTKRLR